MDYNPYEDGGEYNLNIHCNELGSIDPGNGEKYCTRSDCLKLCQKVPLMKCCEYHEESKNCIAQFGDCAANPDNTIDPSGPGTSDTSDIFRCATKGRICCKRFSFLWNYF